MIQKIKKALARTVSLRFIKVIMELFVAVAAKVDELLK
jgi:hypothetical protein